MEDEKDAMVEKTTHMPSWRTRLESFKVTGQGMYALAFITYLVISFLRNSTYADYVISSNALQRCNYLLVAILACKVYFFDKQTVRSFLLNSAVIVVGLVVWRKSHALDVLMMVMLILGARGIPFKAINEWFLKVGTILLLFCMLSFLVGITKDLIFVRHGVDRHSLGILYPTDFAAHVFFLILSYCYYAFERLNWRHYLTFALLAVLLFKLTQARLDVVAIILIIPVMAIAKAAKQGSGVAKIFASFYWGVSIVMAYLTMMMAYFYSGKNHLLTKVNSLISGRLQIGQEAIQRYGMSPLGNRVVEHGFGASAGAKMFYSSGMGSGYFYIDSSFIRLLVIYGLVAAVFFLGVMMVISLRPTLGGDYRLAAIMMMVALSCMIEQHLLDLSFNPFLLALLAGPIIMNEKKTREV